jgi:transposase
MVKFPLRDIDGDVSAVVTIATDITERRRSAEERAELEHRFACYTRPHRQVLRAKLVLMAADGDTNTEIGERLGMSREAAGRWRRCFCEQRLDGLSDKPGRAGRAVFPPEEVAQVKALACELPRTEGVPLSRFSRAELHRLVVERGVTDASAATIARWLSEDSLRPWQHRSWIFPPIPPSQSGPGRCSTSIGAAGRGGCFTPATS